MSRNHNYQNFGNPTGSRCTFPTQPNYISTQTTSQHCVYQPHNLSIQQTYPNMYMSGGGNSSPQYAQLVNIGTNMEDAYVVEQGHIASPVRSTFLPPAETLFNGKEMVPFGQISSPPSIYATENVYLMPYGVEHTEYSVGQQENWQSNSDFDNTSSPPASQFSCSATSSFEESGSELAEFLDPIIDSEKAANPKVATKMVCKKVCRKDGQVGKRGRPRDPNKNNKKNAYMQTYHQKLVSNCEKSEELVNLFCQLFNNCHSYIPNCPENRKICSEIEVLKNWLKNDDNRRPNSKLFFSKRK